MDYSDLPKLPGIYLIENFINGIQYVGQADNIRERVRKHKESLLAGKHKNPKLQASFNVYLSGAFVVYVLCTVEDKSLLDRYEQEWLDFFLLELGKDNCYNLCFEPGTTRGMKLSEEARAKMSSKKRGQKQSPEWAAKRGKASAQTRKELGLYSGEHTKPRKQFRVIDPEGNIHTVNGLSDFAKQHGLNAGMLSEMNNGKRNSVRGWKLFVEV